MQQQQSGKQPQQMGFNGGGGGNESNRGGLTRFWSAPSTWLDTLIQPEIENPPPPILPSPPAPPLPPPPPQNHNLPPQLPKLRNLNNYSSSQNNFFTDGTTELGFLRQNSSPAEILASLTSLSGVGSDDYLPNFGGSGNYDYLSSSLEFPNNKRSRGSEFHQEPRKNSPSMKAEQSEFSSFADMEMEKIFEDSVPCRVRAKRGCATHPRSIAERVRRTRISDRIRKLQDLVPNMDKQTNTADMLDEAVEYVKFLQNQIQELSEHQRNCKCLVRS